MRERADQLLEFVQLTDRARDKVEPLSGGMKRRLTIARSLINEPDLLLLDEPTTGLDPQARHVVWDRLYRLKQQGVTLVLTTHYMDEAEQLCDRLVVMDGGRFAAEGSPRELIERYSTREVVELRFAPGDNEAMAEKVAGLADRVEVLPTGCCSTPTTATRRSTVCRPAAWPRSPCSCGAARSRTSSCGSPAARWSTDGRGRLMDGSALRSYEYWALQYRRTWRGTVVTSVVTPVLFLAAMGVGLGSLVRRTAARRRELPGVRRAWPARGDRHADRRRRGDLAGARRDQVAAAVPRDARHAAHGSRHRGSATCCGWPAGC